jgi:hypothetical protein
MTSRAYRGPRVPTWVRIAPFPLFGGVCADATEIGTVRNSEPVRLIGAILSAEDVFVGGLWRFNTLYARA